MSTFNVLSDPSLALRVITTQPPISDPTGFGALLSLSQLEHVWDACKDAAEALVHGATVGPGDDVPYWSPTFAAMRAGALWVTQHPDHPVLAEIARYLPDPTYFALASDVLAEDGEDGMVCVAGLPYDHHIATDVGDVEGPLDGGPSAGLVAVGLLSGEPGSGVEARVRIVYWPGAVAAVAAEAGWRPYTLVDGGYEQGVGVRVSVVVTLARSVGEAVQRACTEWCRPVVSTPWPGLDVHVGLHRPLLEAYLSPDFLEELDEQLPKSGTLSFVWAFRNS